MARDEQPQPTAEIPSPVPSPAGRVLLRRLGLSTLAGGAVGGAVMLLPLSGRLPGAGEGAGGLAGLVAFVAVYLADKLLDTWRERTVLREQRTSMELSHRQARLTLKAALRDDRLRGIQVDLPDGTRLRVEPGPGPESRAARRQLKAVPPAADGEP